MGDAICKIESTGDARNPFWVRHGRCAIERARYGRGAVLSARRSRRSFGSSCAEEQMEEQPIFERVPSGVPGLDAVLRGGFLRAGTYVLSGASGTGKTLLA